MFKKLIALFLLVSACGQAGDLANKDTLKIGIPAEPVTLFPYGSNDNATARVSVNIFDRLIEKDENGNLVPSLATSWEMLNPTQLRLTLRSNVLFHNGEKFTSADVKYSLERAVNSPEIAHLSDPIGSVEIIDDLTVIVQLKAPFAPILAHLAHSAMGILNQKAAEAAGEDIDQRPVGTGPYMLKTWNRGQSVLLAAFPDYWGDAPGVPNVELRVIPEASARTIALQTGDVDVSYDIESVDRETVRNDPNLQLTEKPLARIEYFGYNIGKGSNPIWKDVRVREAVALAIDRDGIINSVLFGAGTPATSLIYETVIGYYGGLPKRERNVARAKELIAEAGIPAGTKVNIWTSEGVRQKTAEVIQANLKELGIEATINVFEWARFLDGTAKGEHDAFLLGWTTVTGDADYGIYNLLHTSAWGGPGNRSFYSNPEVDRLLEAARVELDPTRRNDLYRQVQVIFNDELPFIPLTYKTSNVGASKKVKGFLFDPADAHKLKTVTF